MKTVLSIPLYAQEMIDEFMAIRLGGKKVVCPYYRNTSKERAGLRALIGKGDPGEIEKEVLVWAKLKDFDLKKANVKQIREFMVANHIGIECSGFVVHVLNFWLKNEEKQPLIKYLTFQNNSIIDKIRRFLRPVENIGANILTNEDNCEKIEKINDVLPGDLIRSKGKIKNAHHVLLITKVIKENDKVKEIEFAHSGETHDEYSGVRVEKIRITNPRGSLLKQDWDVIVNGMSQLDGYKIQSEDNGIRRLKNIKFEYIVSEVD
jgi:hypothetical protein